MSARRSLFINIVSSSEENFSKTPSNNLYLEHLDDIPPRPSNPPPPLYQPPQLVMGINQTPLSHNQQTFPPPGPSTLLEPNDFPHMHNTLCQCSKNTGDDIHALR